MANLRRNRTKVHVVIPDSHAQPGVHNKRYELVGHLINEVRPDVVVDIGDWFDMPSLCSYDKGKKGFEGRRYKHDIDAGLDANDRMLHIIRQQKRKLPRFVRVLGNHENRITRAIETDPILEGTIGIEDLQSSQYKWEEFPFLEPAVVDGIMYQHYFTSGNMGRPIGGDNTARMLCMKNFMSSTCGHGHQQDYAVRMSADGHAIHGNSVGCLVDFDCKWAGPSQKTWWGGITIKREVENGSYDMERVSLKRLNRLYGGK